MITRNRGDQIHSALENLLRLPEQPHIIVLDNGSADETVPIARRLSGPIEVIELGRNMGGAGRNVGVMHAQTPYVAFNDDDSWWAPGSLQRAVDLFNSHPDLGLIAARILVGPEEKLDPLCEVMIHSGLVDDRCSDNSCVGIPVVGFAACGSIIRCDAFLAAGGFEERFGVGGEEHILALDLLRNGWRLAYVDEVIAHHFPFPVRDQRRRKSMEVRNAFWSAWLRRPTRTAMMETWRLLRRSVRNPVYRRGLAEGIAGLSWVLQARRPIPTSIDRQVKIAEKVFHQKFNSH
jgi:N-acetylglucosaminyl-diphospho-decaprenol L-rhamnosyltransferase